MTDYTPHEATVREAQALPAMLPARLVGREAALSQVYGQLKAGQPVLVHGAAGIGKTALAATLASAYAQQPGGVLWLNVDNPRLEELLVRVGRAYNVPEIANADNPLGMIGAVENTLKRAKPFIVLDGRISADVASRFISRCVDGLPTLIATEPNLEGPWTSVELTRLETDAAMALFRQEARLQGNEADNDIRSLVEYLGGVPFGLVIAARTMAAGKQTPSAYFHNLQQITNAVGGNPLVGVLTISFRALTAPLQGLILMMGATFDGRGSADLLSLVSGAPSESVQQAMNILTTLNLAERTQRYGNPYYRLHPVVHAFAQSWLKGSNRLDELQAKVRDSVLVYARKYNGSTSEAYNKMALEMDSFLAAARWAAERGERPYAVELATVISQAGSFITERGYLYEIGLLRELGRVSTTFPGHGIPEAVPTSLPFDEEEDIDDEYDDEAYEALLDLHDEDDVEDDEAYEDEDILDLDEDEIVDEDDEEVVPPLATRLFNPLTTDEDLADNDEDDLDTDDEDDEAVAAEVPSSIFGTSRVAPVSVDLNTNDINSLRTSLVQARQSGDRQLQLRILKAIGQNQIRQKAENEAITTYTEILSLQESLENQEGILETLDMLSSLIVKTENDRAAEMYAARGVKLAEQLGDNTTRMHLLITLADARQQLGESHIALDDYGQALEIARNQDDTQHEAIILYKLGYAHMDEGDTDTAVETWEQALTLFKSQGKRNYEGRVLGALGSAYGDLNRWEEALNFHTSALHIAREVGDKEDEALQLSSLGYAAVQANQLGQALLRYRQALYLAFESDDRENIVSTIVDICHLLVESRKHVNIAKLLIDEAAALEPNDRDVRQLEERIESERKLAEAYQTELLPVKGTARLYAENAYQLL